MNVIALRPIVGAVAPAKPRTVLLSSAKLDRVKLGQAPTTTLATLLADGRLIQNGAKLPGGWTYVYEGATLVGRAFGNYAAARLRGK